MKKIFFTILCLVCPFLLEAQSLQIEFDYDNLDQTISILEKQEIDSDQLSNFLSLKGTKALYQKIGVDSLTTRMALRQAVEGINPDKDYSDFQYIPIRDHLEWMKKFRKEIRGNETVIRDSLVSGLSPYIPRGTTKKIKIHFILGGYSSGFTLGGTSDFFVGIQHYKGDLFSIINTCKHEVFHLIQNSLYDFPEVNTLLEERNLGAAYVHALIYSLFQEGTAEFIADYNDYPQDAPHIQELKEHMDVNRFREQEVFYLISNLVVHAYEHPEQVDYASLYNILFSWNWNNPAYFAGYEITAALVEEHGPEYLKKALRRDPVYFVIDYLELENKPNDGLPYFTDEFSDILHSLHEDLDKLK